jgi:hypothetical protein
MAADFIRPPVPTPRVGGAALGVTYQPPAPAPLEPADAELLDAATRTMQAALDEVMRRAAVWAQAVDGQPEHRARAVAMLAADLRNRVSGAPGGWAALVAEMAMQMIEGGRNDD